MEINRHRDPEDHGRARASVTPISSCRLTIGFIGTTVGALGWGGLSFLRTAISSFPCRRMSTRCSYLPFRVLPGDVAVVVLGAASIRVFATIYPSGRRRSSIPERRSRPSIRRSTNAISFASSMLFRASYICLSRCPGSSRATRSAGSFTVLRDLDLAVDAGQWSRSSARRALERARCCTSWAAWTGSMRAHRTSTASNDRDGGRRRSSLP